MSASDHSHAPRIGLYPGTFDPITNGHLDIIRRASRIVDHLVIGVAENPGKSPLFSVAERVAMVRRETDAMLGQGNVEVVSFHNLLMHFAASIGAKIIIRGLRAMSDFEYEFQMVGINHSLNPDIETAFLMADVHHQAVASRLVKEIVRFGGDASIFVPYGVAQDLQARLAPAGDMTSPVP